MATTISISSGPLTVTRTFQNDTKAQAAMLEFYRAYNLGPSDNTSRQKLELILQWIVDQFINVSVQGYVDVQRTTLEETARGIYKFDDT